MPYIASVHRPAIGFEQGVKRCRLLTLEFAARTGLKKALRGALPSFLAMGALALGGCGAPAETPALTPRMEPVSAVEPLPEPVGTLHVHYLDVGTADSTLLQGPDFTILIDAGLPDRNEAVPYLTSVGVESIDLLIGTHPHDDHIGQFPDVLEAFPVSEVWMSGGIDTVQTLERAVKTLLRVLEPERRVDTSSTFRCTIDAIAASGAGYNEPRAGEIYTVGSSRIEVVHPAALTGDLNRDSVSVRIVYGEVVFLFTGDAGKDAENSMIARGHDLGADILQLGHHGSGQASSRKFLEVVKPQVAIYSAGEEHWLAGSFREAFSYAKPHPDVLDRLAAMDVEVYGTDRYGTIVVMTDGITYEVVLEHGTSVTKQNCARR